MLRLRGPGVFTGLALRRAVNASPGARHGVPHSALLVFLGSPIMTLMGREP